MVLKFWDSRLRAWVFEGEVARLERLREWAFLILKDGKPRLVTEDGEPMEPACDVVGDKAQWAKRLKRHDVVFFSIPLLGQKGTFVDALDLLLICVEYKDGNKRRYLFNGVGTTAVVYLLNDEGKTIERM